MTAAVLSSGVPHLPPTAASLRLRVSQQSIELQYIKEQPSLVLIENPSQIGFAGGFGDFSQELGALMLAVEDESLRRGPRPTLAKRDVQQRLERNPEVLCEKRGNCLLPEL